MAGESVFLNKRRPWASGTSCAHYALLPRIPRHILAPAVRLNAHLASHAAVKCHRTIALQRLVLADRVLKIPMVQRDIFRPTLLVSKLLNILGEVGLRLDREACACESERRLMAAQHVLDRR